MDTFCGVMLKATELIHGLLESGQKEIISTVAQELDELRKMGLVEPAAGDSPEDGRKTSACMFGVTR